jgi:hypothetical protein
MNPIKLIQFLFFYLVLQSCAQQKTDQTATTAEVVNNDARREYVDSTYRYVEYDSAHYHIQFKYFLKKGELFAVHVIDTLQKIDSVTYFKKNIPSFTRKTTAPNAVDIGKWYTLHPERSVYANFDDSLKVNYWEALEMAQKRGFSLPELEVSLLHETNQESWMFYKPEHKGERTQVLLINCDNGTAQEMKMRIK